MGIAVGRVGMSRSDFERCTPLEFSKIVQAVNENVDADNKRAEAVIRAGWEQTRIQVVTMTNIFSTKPIDAKKFWPLPWDGETGTGAEVRKGTSSIDRMRELEARLKRR